MLFWQTFVIYINNVRSSSKLADDGPLYYFTNPSQLHDTVTSLSSLYVGREVVFDVELWNDLCTLDCNDTNVTG